MSRFIVEEVMENIRREIKDKGLCISELYYIGAYHNKLLAQLKKPKELVIFGAGDYGKIVLEDMEQHGISTIKCFCDNNKKAIGSDIGKYSVLSPEEAWRQYPEACFVITPRGFENEILFQLIHMGVLIDNILIFNIMNTGLEIGS